MNTQSTVQLAGEHLRAGHYRQALDLYELASLELGAENFRWNIEHCRARLDEQKASEDVRALHRKTFDEAFDHIYLVNLRSAVKRRLSVARHLAQHQIRPALHEAVNGYVGEARRRHEAYAARPLGQLTRYPEFAELERKRGKPFIESAGAVGYILTYLDILQDAQQKGYRRILILEDDILLHQHFFARFHAFLQQTGPDWKLLQLGASQYNWSSVNEVQALRDGHYAPRRLDTCGSFAIGIDASLYAELIEAESALEAPFDHLPMGEIYERHLGACFVCYPNIVMPDVASSSIRGGRTQRSHSEKMRWRMADFDYPLPRPSVAVLVTSAQNLRYLDSFERASQRPYDLRLYIQTDDGPRPVHHRELLDRPFNAIRPVEGPLSLPPCDVAATLAADAVLTEQDIVAYLDAHLLGRPHHTPLQPLAVCHPEVVRSMVSIIIPTYQRPGNLAQALESAASQAYANKEILVVSDNAAGSDFNAQTREIVEACRQRHPEVPIHLVQHVHNRNGAAARNTGMLHSHGEFISFLDDDDIYLPGRVEQAVKALRHSDATVGAVYCGFLGWNSPVNDPKRYRSGNLTRELLLLDYKSHYLHTNTATYKRTALERLNGFDETYRRHQDIELNLRFFEEHVVAVVPEAGARLNPAPSTVSNKVFNADMLALKQKFLGQFRYLIDSLEESVRCRVYDLHWQEVARYTTDRDSTLRHLNSIDTNGPLQTFIRLARTEPATAT